MRRSLTAFYPRSKNSISPSLSGSVVTSQACRKQQAMTSTESLVLLKGTALVRKDSVTRRQTWNNLESQRTWRSVPAGTSRQYKTTVGLEPSFLERFTSKQGTEETGEPAGVPGGGGGGGDLQRPLQPQGPSPRRMSGEGETGPSSAARRVQGSERHCSSPCP